MTSLSTTLNQVTGRRWRLARGTVNSSGKTVFSLAMFAEGLNIVFLSMLHIKDIANLYATAQDVLNQIDCILHLRFPQIPRQPSLFRMLHEAAVVNGEPNAGRTIYKHSFWISFDGTDLGCRYPPTIFRHIPRFIVGSDKCPPKKACDLCLRVGTNLRIIASRRTHLRTHRDICLKSCHMMCDRCGKSITVDHSKLPYYERIVTNELRGFNATGWRRNTKERRFYCPEHAEPEHELAWPPFMSESDE